MGEFGGGKDVEEGVSGVGVFDEGCGHGLSGVGGDGVRGSEREGDCK